MKISKEKFAILSDAIARNEAIASTMAGYIEAGLTPERFRWDCLWTSEPMLPAGFVRSLYGDGLNDCHIDTALRSITKTGGEW